MTSQRLGRSTLVLLLLLGVPLRSFGQSAQVVKDRVDRAMTYLETAADGRLGVRALVGLTFAKYGAPEDHAKIQEAVKALQNSLKNGADKFNADIYSTGISIMFLVAVDPSKYRYEIETLVASLHRRQKDDGAWGYPATHPTHGATCDTSMTQYAVLGLWEAQEQAGVETPPEVWDRVARWLVLTQDPSGGFGYQGKPAERFGLNEKQGSVKHSLTAAAVGSLYVVKDRVGIRKLKKGLDDDTPAAFELYETPEERQQKITTSVDLRMFARAVAKGDQWVEKNYPLDKWMQDDHKAEKPTDFVHYSLYALERYETLWETDKSGGSIPLTKDQKSKWWTRGARYLIKNQLGDGSWESRAGLVPDTCFGVLFLLGSTRKTLNRSSVETYEAGLLIGGTGMPRSKQVRLRDGRVVVRPMDGKIDAVLNVLADPRHRQYANAVEALADRAATGTPDELRRHGKQLGRIAVFGRGEARRLAVRALARATDIDRVPVLIYLLEDPDTELVVECGRALGAVSRKYTTFGLDEQVTAATRERAIGQWRDWFRTVRPDVDLDVFDPTTALQ